MLPQGLIIAHVGDSRIYRVRNNVIEQLTFDHSLVWEVCKATKTPFDQAPPYIPKNQITRSLGPTERLVVDKEGPFPIQVGDVFIACSDGLSGPVHDNEIGEVLTIFPPETAAETLVNLANLRGGSDNCTMVIAQAVQTSTSEQEIADELQVPTSAWAVLVAALLCGAGAAGSFLLNSAFLGVLLSVITVALLFYFYLLAKHSLFSPSPFVEVPPTGKGPYRSFPCAPTLEFAIVLEKVYREVRQAANDKKFSVNFQEANTCKSAAMAAVQQNNAGEAVRNYCLAINSLMRELKKSRKRRT
jgi:protein phosphatase